MDDQPIAAPLRSNLVEYTVSELSRALKLDRAEFRLCTSARQDRVLIGAAMQGGLR
jgi:hypothetical protein